MMIGEKVYGRLQPVDIKKILDDLDVLPARGSTAGDGNIDKR